MVKCNFLSYWPHLKCSITTWGQRLPYWPAQRWSISLTAESSIRHWWETGSFYHRGRQAFPVKDQSVTILDFEPMKAGTDNTQTGDHSCIPIKLHSQRKGSRPHLARQPPVVPLLYCITLFVSFTALSIL